MFDAATIIGRFGDTVIFEPPDAIRAEDYAKAMHYVGNALAYWKDDEAFPWLTKVSGGSAAHRQKRSEMIHDREEMIRWLLMAIGLIGRCRRLDYGEKIAKFPEMKHD